MSQHTLPGAARLRLAAPMTGRDPAQPERASTPLELFYDLVVVVAVASAASSLHHAIVEGHATEAILSYLLVFFGVWWAWVNFTWFASAYDSDDVAFRLSVFAFTTGALVFAAGVPAIFDERVFTLGVIGYVIMRLALVTQWLRVAHDDRPRRTTALRFAGGVSACQVAWLLLLIVPDAWPIIWLVVVPAEILVPMWAESAGRTPFHPEHIAERYGLFVIIVLGESVLAASLAIGGVLDGSGLGGELLGVIVGSLLILYSLWWVYFDRPEEHYLETLRTAFAWAFLHLPIFAAVAAVGAGLAVAIEEASGHAHVGWTTVGAAVAIPVSIYLASLWVMYARLVDRVRRAIMPVTIALILGAIFTPSPVLAIGLVLAGMTTVKIAIRLRETRTDVETPSSGHGSPA